MLKYQNQSRILGFTINPDLVCRRYENRAWRGVFGVQQWSYKLETNILKQNAFLPFILKEQGFKEAGGGGSSSKFSQIDFIVVSERGE